MQTGKASTGGAVCIAHLFEDYALDADRRELRRDDAVVPVEPQVFDLLAYLVLPRDRVVSKDDLLTAVWNGRVVSESALTTRINAVRAALGDNGDAQRLIRTLRGHGFRFVGEVREFGDAARSSPLRLALPDQQCALPGRCWSVLYIADGCAPARPLQKLWGGNSACPGARH
jgi:DNA-binding winged helix-turn-helix (wHTH) protein